MSNKSPVASSKSPAGSMQPKTHFSGTFTGTSPINSPHDSGYSIIADSKIIAKSDEPVHTLKNKVERIKFK